MYIALYQHVTREIRERCGRVAKDVIVELASYTNPLGICWPGEARLAADTGYCVDTVKNALQALLEADYIRIHERYSSVRQRWEFEAYQLSPEVLSIRPELYAQALRSYDYCNTRNSFVSKDSQPSPEPYTENHLQEPPTVEPTPTTKDSLTVKNPVSTNVPPPTNHAAAPTEKQSQKKQKTTSAPTGATHQKNYAAWVNPLQDESAEECAFLIWNESGGGMPMPVARYLVDSRGVAPCRAAVRNYQRNAARIENPAGYIRVLIEKSAVDPAFDDIPQAPATRSDDSWY